MRPVESFRSSLRGEWGLDVFVDHIRIDDADVPYDRIAEVAVAGPDPDGVFPLSRVILRLDDGEEHVVRLPTDEAERARLLITVPYARQSALLDLGIDREAPPQVDPLGGGALFPLKSEQVSLGTAPSEEETLLPLEPQAPAPPYPDGPELFPLDEGSAHTPSPPPAPLLLHEVWRSAKPIGDNGSGSEPLRSEARPRRRGPADMVFAGLLLAAAVGAVIFLVVPHRAHQPASARAASGAAVAGQATPSAAPSHHHRQSPAVTPPSPAGHKHHRAKKASHKRSSQPAHQSTGTPQPVQAPPLPQPTTVAPAPAPSPQPPPPPKPKPKPKPKPSISTSAPPPPSPSISTG